MSKLTTPIDTHKTIPKNKGRIPTDFSTLSDRPEPIKNSVIVIPFFESATIKEVMASGSSKIVLATIAKIKKRMNQGIFLFKKECCSN